MWLFKKKEKKVKPKYKINEDRFIVEIYKDESMYRVNVYDKWSKRFMSDEDLDRKKLLCNSHFFFVDEKDRENLWVEMKIEIIIEQSKVKLRDDFIKAWNKFEKSKKNKKEVK